MATTTKFQNRSTGETIEIRADFAQAASQIFAKYDDGDHSSDNDAEWSSTPYQVADARHCARAALTLVLEWWESCEG